jgi:ubiquinol-cytochrome c reductase iron-sulfur subunit
MNTPALPLTAAADPERRTWLLATGVAGAAAAIGTAVPLVSGLAPSERARAMGAAVEVDLADIPPGGLKTVEWRGKPVWVMRRTPEMLAGLAALDGQLADPKSLRDDLPEPARNPQRSLRPEIFVAVGICTHLGCSPTAVAAGTAHPSVGDSWSGGFFCPCHGSTFDLAGRVFKNKPAPTNLEVPPHQFLSDNRLLIGESAA